MKREEGTKRLFFKKIMVNSCFPMIVFKIRAGMMRRKVLTLKNRLNIIEENK
jgi:hypothetical protein